MCGVVAVFSDATRHELAGVVAAAAVVVVVVWMEVLFIYLVSGS